jgi:uncharacterized membrane protein
LARIIGIFLAGLFVLLPIFVTVVVIAWIASFLSAYVGPGSLLGRMIAALGLNVLSSPTGAYFLGLLMIVGAIFLLGILVESRLRPLIQGSLDWLMMRIPLISNVYELSKRFVAIVDRGQGGGDDLKSMSPVWCFFGGEGGAAVLALMPSAEPVVVGEHRYLGVLVPSAPVPIGGALIYVPEEWVKPAEGGVERLMNVYVSMGVTPPVSKPSGVMIEAGKSALAAPKKAPKPPPRVASLKAPKGA